MTTDIVLARLTADLRRVRIRSAAGELAVLGALGGVEVVLVFAIGAARPDMAAAAGSAVFWWKLTSLAVLACAGLGVTVMSIAPDRVPERGLRWLALALATALASGMGLALAQPSGGGVLDRLDWFHGIRCASLIVVLSLPIVGAVAVLARRGAATDADGTALAAGVGGAAAGAFVFAFACPANDPLYIMVWYLVGCGAVASLARLTLPRLMRW